MKVRPPAPGANRRPGQVPGPVYSDKSGLLTMVDSVCFRAATCSDLSFVLRAERDYMTAIEPERLEQWTAAIDRNLDVWVDNLDTTTFVEVEDARAGFVMWTQKGDAALIITIQVLPTHRRTGIASTMLTLVEDQAAGAGLRFVELGVHSRNPARALYEAARYSRAGEDGDYVLFRKTTTERASS